MRRWAALLAIVAALGAFGCAETVRCPDGEIFDVADRCIPIPDSGRPPIDAGTDAGS